MGILMMIFSTKIEKRNFFESLIHGDFNIFSKKKWKINIFYMCLEFIHMQIWTLFFTKIRKMKIYCTSWKFSHIGVLTIFSKKNREMNVGYICRSVTQTYQEKYLADDKYAPFGTSYSTEVLLKNDTQKVIAAVFGDIKQKICELCAFRHFLLQNDTFQK